MENLLVSFSGGRTSARMAKLIKDKWGHKYNIVFVFANTGEEHPLTLGFVDKCDKEFGLNLVWVEADVHEGREGTTHNIVNYKTASRNGEPFEDVIKKYGIPNASYPHCNRELKLAPMHSFAREHFGSKDYYSAIGIRIDEPKRLGGSTVEQYCKGALYPLAHEWPMDKQDVIEWWEEQPFDLEIPEHYGNCKTCWKKSDRKLFTVIDEHPEWFDFNRRCEDEYASCRAGGDRVFFRQYRSTEDMFKLYETVGFKRFKEECNTQLKMFGYDIDENSGCTEECNGF